jgi:membrane protease YdiL (CAAX protease family)
MTKWFSLLEHSAGVLLPVALAMLVEAACYLSLVSERWRARWTPLALTVLAPASYLLYTVPLGLFDIRQLAAILAAVALAAYWFRVFGRSGWSEGAFLALAAAVVAFKATRWIYPPAGELRVDIIGSLVWIRVALITVLHELRPEGVNFGFWPTRRDWKIGAVAYATILPVLALLASWTGFAAFAWPPWSWQETAVRATGQFFGILWVVALSEEFFFRGILQRRIGILATSVAFGLVHLGYREFPNWPMAAIAALTGLAYGAAYERARSVRAAMVAHALTVVTWKILFR